MANGLTPPHVSHITTYLIAVLALATLLVAAVIAFALIGLDAASTPLAVSALGFLTTVGGVLLVLLRVESVNSNVNGHLTQQTAKIEELHERLAVQAGATP